MNHQSERFPTAVMVRPLNFEALAQQAALRYNAAHAAKPARLMANPGARQGYITTPCGIFVLDAGGEGLADVVTDENRLTVVFIPVVDDGWDSAGCVSFRLSAGQVEEFGMAHEVNLAEFIMRGEIGHVYWLEERYEDWRQEMERAMRLKDAP